MVLGVALDRQRPALDRVGEHHRRPVVVDRPVGLDQLRRVVAAEVAQGGAQLVVGQVADQLRELAAASRQPLAQLLAAASAAGAGTPRSASPSMRLRSSGPPGRSNSASSRPPYFTVIVCQPAASNMLRPATEGDLRHHAVERLAVEVDHPDDLAELRHARVRDRLPDGALVQLGVAHQRELAAHRRRLEAVGVEVAAREGAPDRGGRPDAHRARRVVDRVRVLGAARVALQAAEGAQRLQRGPVQAAEQVVDRVQRRRRVRLHRHPILGAQLREPERGHQAHHRRARGLVAADLHARAVLAHAVGVVDDRRGEPEHPPLDCPQRRRGQESRAAATAVSWSANHSRTAIFPSLNVNTMKIGI